MRIGADVGAAVVLTADGGVRWGCWLGLTIEAAPPPEAGAGGRRGQRALGVTRGRILEKFGSAKTDL